eukprot:scaffold5078_cov63-Phaeocystis_antarctica.AAC.17
MPKWSRKCGGVYRGAPPAAARNVERLDVRALPRWATSALRPPPSALRPAPSALRPAPSGLGLASVRPCVSLPVCLSVWRPASVVGATTGTRSLRLRLGDRHLVLGRRARRGEGVHRALEGEHL